MVSATRCKGMTQAGIADRLSLRCSRALRRCSGAYLPVPFPIARTAFDHATKCWRSCSVIR